MTEAFSAYFTGPSEELLSFYKSFSPNKFLLINKMKENNRNEDKLLNAFLS